MRVQRDNLSLPAAVDLDPFIRVKLDSGNCVPADAADLEIGVTSERFLAAEGGKCSVTPINATGSIRMTAGAAISAGQSVFGGADGKISAISNANAIGIALTSASGDGGYVEVLPRSDMPTT